MRIAVVEDNMENRIQLLDYLHQYMEKTAIQATMDIFEKGKDFLEALRIQEFDMVFLDIFLEPEISGMEVAHRIRKKNQNCKIVFTTISDSFAVESYQVRAFDYLLKPFQYERLKWTMERYAEESQAVARYIQIKTGRIQRKVLLSDIIYADYNNHYIQVHTEKEVLRSYMPFGDLADMLKEFPQFLYCYRNCIINMDEVTVYDNGDFVMSNQERIPVYRKLRTDMKQAYADYIFAKMNRGS